MEIEKEGLYTYGVISSVRNDYFVTVEYPLICYNHPKTLLPLRLREQDGEIRLYYDITDGKTVLEYAESRRFSLSDSKDFLICLKELLIDMEELMLSPEHVKFSPDSIYKVEDHSFQWMYCPDEKNDLSEDVQQFFAWMLSEIDYGDSDTVRFVYHIYWLIRNRSLSVEMIQECLDYEKIQGKEKVTSYEEFFENPKNRPESQMKKGTENEMKSEMRQNEFSRKNDIGMWDNQRTSFPMKDTTFEKEGKTVKSDGKGSLILEIALILFLCVDAVAIVYFVRQIFYQGISSLYIRYMIGCILLLVGFIIGIVRVHRGWAKKKSIEENNMNLDITKENFDTKMMSSDRYYGEYDSQKFDGNHNFSGQVPSGTSTEKYSYESYEENYTNSYGQGKVADIDMKTNDMASHVQWSTPLRKDMEVEDGTVRLDLGSPGRQAALKNESTGELCEIHNFPFYIGNETGLNHLSISDKTVSRQHAVIQRGEKVGTYEICDLQSTNGTWVNLEKIGENPVNLQPGSRIRFAEQCYRFEIL